MRWPWRRRHDPVADAIANMSQSICRRLACIEMAIREPDRLTELTRRLRKANKQLEDAITKQEDRQHG